jgi:hypothetical protein
MEETHERPGGAAMTDFLAWADKVLDAATKLKKVMQKKRITSAKAKCPMCAEGFLHGRLAGRKQHLSMWCDGCTVQMME